MDFELLNFWINKLNLDIRHDYDYGKEKPRLYILLKAYDDDFLYTYVLLLSENKNDILEYLGFDTTIEYDKLTENNMFEYLCTSTKLNPANIQYCGFKGPCPKNTLHSKFNKYLLNKNYSKDNQKHVLNNEQIITFFKKVNDYEEYKNKRSLMNIVMCKNKILHGKHKEFSRFITVYGIISVSKMNDVELIEKWKDFNTENWSILKVFGL